MTKLLMEQLGEAPKDLEEALITECLFADALAAEAADPKSAHEALNGPQAAEWRAAIAKEMKAMTDFGVWDPELVELPQGKTAVDSKVVFRTKRDAHGAVLEHKARFVARGFSQRPGEDYGDTYSPVTMLTSVRLLLALSVLKGWEVHLVDFKNAFLNAPLTEEIYLRQPTGTDDGTGRVYRLRKALYGLKQAPLLWNEELGKLLEEHGYNASHADPSLFIRIEEDGSTFLPAWVDDVMVVGSNKASVARAKKELGSRYPTKDLGEISTYLGMQVHRNVEEGWLELSLEKYLKGVAEKFSTLLEDSHKVRTPMAPDTLSKIRKEQGTWTKAEAEKVPREEFLSVVGSIMFAATAARPDMAFTASVLAQASADPRAIHMGAAVRALRYMVDTRDLALRYHRDMGSKVLGYTDSDHANEADGLSRAAFVFELGGGAFSWSSKKLKGVATSTTEAEYKALSAGAKEATWLQMLLKELGVEHGPIELRCDNQSAHKLAEKKSKLNLKTKHVKLAWHYVKEAIREQDVCVAFVRTGQQDADMLTKALDGPKFKDNRERIGLWPMHGK
jgi:hypothetical protein